MVAENKAPHRGKKELSPHGFSNNNKAFISNGLPPFLAGFRVMMRIGMCTFTTLVFDITYGIDRYTFELVHRACE